MERLLANRLTAHLSLAPLVALALLSGTAVGQIEPAATTAQGLGAAGLTEPAPVQNVLVLIADDLGVDGLSSYGEGNDLPITPVLDGLAASGVSFRNAWSQPVCSPTRAGIFTGRHGFRTGIGHIVTVTSQALPISEVTLPELLTQEQPGYSHALIGKWHLGNDSVGGVLSPDLAGWTKFDGSLFSFEPAPLSYTSWPRILAGTQRISTHYATTAHVDAALKWVENNAGGPWILFLAFDAPHAPYHVPTAGLYYEDLTGLDPERKRPLYKAMIESMDTEIGRLLDGIDALPTAPPMVIFVGDNGTPNEVAEPPILPGKAKNSLFEGGLNVPLIVSGREGTPPGSFCDQLVHTTDLFATVAELAGIDVAAALPAVVLDSVSCLSLIEDPSGPAIHPYVYAELFTPTGLPVPTNARQAVRDLNYKLIRRPTGEEFYNLVADPYENVNLLGDVLTPVQQAAYDQLVTALSGYTSG